MKEGIAVVEKKIQRKQSVSDLGYTQKEIGRTSSIMITENKAFVSLGCKKESNSECPVAGYRKEFVRVHSFVMIQVQREESSRKAASTRYHRTQ